MNWNVIFFNYSDSYKFNIIDYFFQCEVQRTIFKFRTLFYRIRPQISWDRVIFETYMYTKKQEIKGTEIIKVYKQNYINEVKFLNCQTLLRNSCFFVFYVTLDSYLRPHFSVFFFLYFTSLDSYLRLYFILKRYL